MVKIALSSMGPFWCLAIRFTIASVLCFVIFGPRVLSRLSGENAKHCLIISVFNASAFVTSNLSLTTTAATTAGFLMSLSVVFTPLLSYFFLRSRFQKSLIPVIGVVVAGLFLLCGGDGTFSFGIGAGFALISSFLLAAAITYSTVYIAGIGAKALSTSQTLTAAVLSFVCALCFEEFPALEAVTVQSWLAIAYLVVFSTIVAYMLQNIALHHVSPVFASLAFSSEPIFTSVAAYFMLGEVLSLTGYIGGALVIIGIATASVLQTR